jgi:AraC-like DNA-binding protein
VIAVAVYPRWSYDRGILRGVADFAASRARLRHALLPEPPGEFAGILRSSSAFGIVGVIGAEGPVLDLAVALGLPCVCVTNVARRYPAPQGDQRRRGDRPADRPAPARAGSPAARLRRLPRLDALRPRAVVGFRAAAAEAGVECHRFAAAPTVTPSLVPGSRRLDRYLEDFARRGGGGPAAAMAGTDHLGVELIAAARRVGLRVPEDLAVAGVDDNDVVFESCVPPLTSLAQHTHRIGLTAATLLSRLVAGDRSVPPLTVVEPGELAVRRSSDHLVVRDPLVAAALREVRDPAVAALKVEALAARLGVSRKTLDARFAGVVGRTPAAEVRRLQVERARRLLLTTDLPMGAVAEAAGFSSAQQLSESFRRETGADADRLPATEPRRRQRSADAVTAAIAVGAMRADAPAAETGGPLSPPATIALVPA